MLNFQDYTTTPNNAYTCISRTRPTKQHALIFGSAPISLGLANEDLSGIKTVAINNAWRIRSDIDYAIYAADFPEDRRPPRSWCPVQITGPDYAPATAMAGGELLCGATMAFVAGYWACANLRTSVIGYYGCDMVYDTPGNTHFYGTGSPDPLREHLSLRSLEAKAMRLFCWGLKRRILIVNCSPSEKSRLVFPRVPLSELTSVSPDFECWADLLSRARRIFELEKQPPFSQFRRDTLDRPETQACRDIIDELDGYWLELIPLMTEIAADAGSFSQSQLAL